MKRTSFLFSLFCLVLPAVVLSQTPSSPTLELGDIFEARPGSSSAQLIGPGRFDPGGPLIVIPDTSAWRLPPQPAEETEPETPVPPLPRLPLLITTTERDRARMDRPAFTFRGTTIDPALAQSSLVQIETPYSHLRTEYRLKSEETGADWVFYHGPESMESFQVEPGRYRLRRRVWRVDYPEVVHEEVYEIQRFVPRGRYEFLAEKAEAERDLMEKLRDRAR